MSLKTPWREKVEQLIKEGKSNQEIIDQVGNPYRNYHVFQSKVGQFKAIMKRKESGEAISVLEEEADAAGIPIENVNYFWYKSKRISINASNDKSIVELLHGITEEMKTYSPVYHKIDRRPILNGTCLVIDPADIHIGKLARAIETGDEYNMDIALKRVREGVKSLIALTYDFGIEKVVLIAGNDVLHIDNKRRTTTSGTPQDTDGMWYDAFNFAKDMYVEIIEMLLAVADVHVVHNMSNHDNVLGWALSQTICAWFSKCPQVTFDVTPNTRKAFLWHDNLIAFSHGDGAKQHELPLLLANEYPKEWAMSKFRNIYMGHLHHKVSKDYTSVTVETSRSASGTDSWHAASGYAHSPKAIECYLHGKGRGQYGRFSHYF